MELEGIEIEQIQKLVMDEWKFYQNSKMMD